MTTLVDLLETRAADAAYVPYTFLEDGEADARSATAAELADRARRIAAMLDARPGDRALIVMPPGLDYIAAFFGCLFAGVIAVPAYPPDPRRLARTVPRLVSIVRAAEARVVVTTRAIAALAPALVPLAPELAPLGWVAIDDAGAEQRRVAGDVAMLQFTSGSTAAPRGVVLGHDNILANLEAITDAFALRERRVISWLPPYHDMGLIGAILAPLYARGSAVMMSPLHFLQRPVRWLRAIARYRGDVSGGPNFAYDLCTRKVDTSSEELDLSCWSVAFNGAEVVRASTMERFADKVAPWRFRRTSLFPCYGLAETSLLATAAPRDAGPTVTAVDGGMRVSSGRAAKGITIVVVDPIARTEQREGCSGEIWLGGASLGRGYWGLADETAHTFGATTADGRGPYLRTGDLGFVIDGELYVTGRIKDLIILNGRKLFPDDLERVASSACEGLRPGGSAAFAIDRDEREQLVIVQEIEAGHDHGEARAAIMRAVFESFDVAPGEVALVPAGAVPKTSSGKVQRHACRHAFLAGEMRGE